MLKDKQRHTKVGTKKKRIFWMTTEMAGQWDREFFLSTNARETVIFIIFLLNLNFITLSMVYTSMYDLTQIMKHQFIYTFFRTGEIYIKYLDVRSAAAFWMYLETKFLDALYWDYWYDKTNPIREATTDEKGILYENKLIGVPRIRQVKVRNNSCTIHPNFKRTFMECFNEYSSAAKDTAPFGLKRGSAWTHTEATNSVILKGTISTYDSGGYYELLSSKINETTNILQNLKENLWITRGTRAVFVDFTVYNANVNLFCITKLSFEFPATGGVIPNAWFKTVKLFRYVTVADFIIFGCELIHFGFILFYLAEEVREILYIKWAYFKLFWTYLDQTIIWTSVSFFVLALIQHVQVSNIVEYMRTNPGEYYSFFLIALTERRYRNMQAVTLFLAYMKIFKYLSINRTMGQLNNTLRKCAKDVFSFSVMFLLIFVSFAQLGFLIFGAQVTEFSTFGTAMFTLLRTILGDFDYSEIEKAHRILAPLYFLMFIFLVFFVLLNMFLAIINDTYIEVKTEMAIAPDQMQMGEFCKRGYYNFMRHCGCAKCIKPLEVMKNEYNATTDQIRGALKKCGFSDMDVDMFFARYNIDPKAVADEKDVSKFIHDLLGQSEKEGIIPGHLKHTTEGVPLVALDDFALQQERLDVIEKVMAQIGTKLDSLLLKLKKFETSQDKKTTKTTYRQ